MDIRTLEAAKRWGRHGLGAAVGIVALAACNALWGIDDLGYDPQGTATGLGGQSSTTTSSGGAGAAAGSGPCEPLSSEACYDGSLLTLGIGECHEGSRTCPESGVGWGPCEGQQLPVTDSCATPTDDDCDGRTCEAEWSLWISSVGADFVQAVAVDASGALFVGGGFSNTVMVGELALASAGETDGFVARIDGEGSVLWARSFGGDGPQDIKCVAPTPGGGLIFATGFAGSIDVGLDTYTSIGDHDLVMAKLDASGETVWSRYSGSNSAENARGVGVDDLGASVIVGNGYGSLDFGGGVRNNGGGSDVFIVKYGPGGEHVWSMLNGNSGNQFATSVAVTPAGVSFVGGRFEGNLDLGSCSLGSAGGSDAFVARFGPGGTCAWALGFGDGSDQSITAIALGSEGGPVIGGRFKSEIDLGCGPLTSPLGEATEGAFVAELSGGGECLWSVGWTGATAQDPWNIAVDELGRTFVVGSFAGTVDLGDGAVTSAGDDMFLVVLDAQGNHLASKSFEVTTAPGPASPVADYWPRRSVALAPEGGLYVAGIFFGSATIAAEPWVSPGDADGFVALFR